MNKRQKISNIKYNTALSEDYATRHAVRLYRLGKKPSCSTFIDGISITAGYGKLESYGDFQYPLPQSYILKKYGCFDWDTFIKSEYNNQ